jgi:glutamate-1-semialdehyde 2,1-aminomutase
MTGGGERDGELWRRARAALPGGVDSPVRAFEAVGGRPFFAESASGAVLRDTEGREYIDYVLSWGPLILGHAHPEVVEAVSGAAARGTSFGTPVRGEVELAEKVKAFFPSLDLVRFVNSGTEATMSAVRLARGHTGRDLVLKFEGCYHGHGDSFLVQAGSGVATLGLPDSPGVPAALSELTVTVPFNDLEAVREVFRRFGGRIACVVLEPVMGNAGVVPPEEGFLAGLRELTRDDGSLLVFDEVMTGFRAAPGGAQERYGVEPDLTTLGKVVGGGLPVGAFGGRREVMEDLAPLGPVYQAGTLSGNPLAMAAGLATLSVLERDDPFADLEARAERLADGVVRAVRERGIPATGSSVGSMWGVHFTEGPVRGYRDARRSDAAFFARYHRACRERGVFFAPSPYEAGFVSTAHGEEEIDRTLEVVGEAVDAARETG